MADLNQENESTETTEEEVEVGQEQTTDTGPDYLAMSDEDFLNAPAPSATAPTEKPEPEPEQEPEGDPEGEGTKDDAAADRKGGEAESDAGDKPEGKSNEEPSKSKEDKSQKSDAGKPESDGKTPSDQPVDYEAAYKDLMAPFKANGREIQPKSIDDVKSLMQMGANYNKKMQAMKPSMKILKMLENNGLLDESKLSYLIDLDKKNPEAIAKLVKDSGVDPLDIDDDKAKGYKSGNYSVDDGQIELDTVMSEIEDTPSFNRTIQIVGKDWDEKSRNTIANAPVILKWINSQVESGVYDIINKEIESERAMGRLTGLSNLDAYKQVGDAINARGGFDHLVPTGSKGQQDQPVQKIVEPNLKKAEEDKLKDKRRAASASRPGTNPNKPTNEYNPLAMSDEEFMKLGNKAHLM